MDTRLDLHLQSRWRRRSAPAAAVPAAGLALVAVILAGVAVLIRDGHGMSWLAGLLVGAAVVACLTVGRGRAGSRRAAVWDGAQRRTEAAVRPLARAGWRFLHQVPGPDRTYDHLAVGPGGVILLESVAPGGVVRMMDGEPVVEQADETAAAPRVRRLRLTALADATELRERVQRVAGRRMWVQAVVIVWSDFPAGCVADGRCVYIQGSRLVEWMARRPQQFDEAETEVMWAAVRELAQRGAELDFPAAV